MPRFSNIIEFEDDGLFQDSRPFFIQAVHRMSHVNLRLKLSVKTKTL